MNHEKPWSVFMLWKVMIWFSLNISVSEQQNQLRMSVGTMEAQFFPQSYVSVSFCSHWRRRGMSSVWQEEARYKALWFQNKSTTCHSPERESKMNWTGNSWWMQSGQRASAAGVLLGHGIRRHKRGQMKEGNLSSASKMIWKLDHWSYGGVNVYLTEALSKGNMLISLIRCKR